ncbi:MAG: DUF5989 family protein [Acidobacteriota bacterium]
MTIAQSSRLSIVGEFWSYMRMRKKFWIGPIVMVLVLMSVFIVVTEGSAILPFIYMIF